MYTYICTQYTYVYNNRKRIIRIIINKIINKMEQFILITIIRIAIL